MRLRVETAVGVGALLALQLATSFAAIGLLSRTSPAAERILREEASIAASEQVLAVLATEGDTEEFANAMERVRKEARGPERELVHRIDARSEQALRGDSLARIDVVTLVQSLSSSSRERMETLDTRARFLGRAGAWASAMLGVGGFLLSILVYRRLRARVEAPLLAVHDTLEQVRHGELRRRADPHAGPAETRRIAENVNVLLDRIEDLQRRPATERVDRRLLLGVLDRLPEAVWLLDAHGQLLATNAAGLKAWDEPGPLRLALSACVRDGLGPPTGWVVEKLESADAWLCRRDALPRASSGIP